MRRPWFLLLSLAMVSCSSERDVSSSPTDATATPTNATESPTTAPDVEATPNPSPSPDVPTAGPTEAPEPTPEATAPPVPTPDPADMDGDGWRADAAAPERDCDDADPSIHPGATELCGTFADEDCNGSGEYSSSPVDYDGDGFPLCAYDRTTLTDCRENDRGSYPGAIEYPDDHIDSNCDGRDF